MKITTPTASHPQATLLHTVHGSHVGTAAVDNRLGTNMVRSYLNVHEGGALDQALF